MSKTCPGNSSRHKPSASPAAGHPIPAAKHHSLKPVRFLFKKMHRREISLNLSGPFERAMHVKSNLRQPFLLGEERAFRSPP